MSRFLYSNDVQGGLTKVWHDHGDGDWAVETIQDVTPLIEENKIIQNHIDTRWQTRANILDENDPRLIDAKLVARIPMVVIELWRSRYGIDYFSQDPDVQKKIDSLLNSNEWRYLRTDNSVL